MEGKLKIEELNEKVLAALKRIWPNKIVEGVISVEKTKTGYKVLVEVLERKAVPDSQDLLGIYEVDVSASGEIHGYKKIKLRHRSDTNTGVE